MAGASFAKRRKECPHCGELCSYSSRICPNPACGKDCRRNAKVGTNGNGNGNGHLNGHSVNGSGVTIEDIRQVKELTGRLGGPAVVQLAELFK